MLNFYPSTTFIGAWKEFDTTLRISYYLWCSSDHVLDEVTMSWGVDNGDHILAGFELPEGDVDGDTTFTLGLQLVQYPGVLEGSLSQLYKRNA